MIDEYAIDPSFQDVIFMFELEKKQEPYDVKKVVVFSLEIG